MMALGLMFGVGLAGRAAPGAAQPASGGQPLPKCQESGRLGLARWEVIIKPDQPISLYAAQSEDLRIDEVNRLNITFRCDVSPSGVKASITILQGVNIDPRDTYRDEPTDSIIEVVARSPQGDVARFSIETDPTPYGVITMNARPSGDLERAIIDGSPVALSIVRRKGGSLPGFALRFADIKPALARAIGVSQAMEKRYQAAQCAPAKPDCFLTTAAVNHVGLADDCWELRMLRRFRDQQLARMPGGAGLIAEYYAIAPGIVAGVSRRADSRRQWIRCYFTGILPCAIAARLGMNRAALRLYQRMTRKLQRLGS